MAPMILERDEGRFFERVTNVHPYASEIQTLDLSENSQSVKFGPDCPLPFLNFKRDGLINYVLKPLFGVKTLIRLVKKENINVIRTTYPYGCEPYACLTGRLTNIPFYFSIHTDYEKNDKLTG